MEWGSLRPIQVDAIHHLLDERGDGIIAAPTAGGKTEAAFLPILSSIADDHSDGVRAMYVGPLKALINDQFRRVGDLCERMEMAVHRWHGDVTSSARQKLLTRPSGVLLITPESLEAMFVLRPTKMRGLFSKLQFVVIDELHAFIGGVRGAQLRSQLHRLDERCEGVERRHPRGAEGRPARLLSDRSRGCPQGHQESRPRCDHPTRSTPASGRSSQTNRVNHGLPHREA